MATASQASGSVVTGAILQFTSKTRKAGVTAAGSIYTSCSRLGWSTTAIVRASDHCDAGLTAVKWIARTNTASTTNTMATTITRANLDTTIFPFESSTTSTVAINAATIAEAFLTS